MSGGSLSEHKVYLALSSTNREEILKQLYRKPLSVDEMAKIFGVRSVTIRHHLQPLQEAGLLETFEKRTGVAGRPKTYYKISKTAPIVGYPARRYMMLSALLLDFINQNMDKSRVSEVLSELATKMGKETLEEIALSHNILKWTIENFEEFFVKETLELFGCEPEIVERSEKRIVVRLHNCIFSELSLKIPDLMCDIFHMQFFTSVVALMDGGVKVSQTSCMGHGDTCCEHVFEWP